MAAVFDPPMSPDVVVPLFGRRTAERGHPEDGLVGPAQHPGFGVTFPHGALQPQNGFDQRFPRRAAEPGLGRKHRQFARFPAVAAFAFARRGTAGLAPHGSKLEPPAQIRLVVFDLREQMIARGDHASERFF